MLHPNALKSKTKEMKILDVTTPKFVARWLVVSGGKKEDQLLFLDLMIPRSNDARMITIEYSEVKDLIDRPTFIRDRLDHMNWIQSDADIHELLAYIIRFKEGVDK